MTAFAYPDTLSDNLNITAYNGQGKADLKIWTGCLWTSARAFQVEETATSGSKSVNNECSKESFGDSATC